MTERKEPTYIFSDKQVAERSEIAGRFLEARTRLNKNVDKADNFLVKRFYNIDHNTYLDGALPAKYVDGASGLGMPALRRLHQLPHHPVLPAGCEPCRTGRGDQRCIGGWAAAS